MKINARLEGYEMVGVEAVITFRISNLRHATIAEGIEKDKLLALDINPVKSKRSAEQNKYMWALLHDIDIAMNGENSNAEWDIYCDALEKAGAKFEYMQCRIEAEEMLKHYFRAVRYVAPADEGFGIYKCYWGSSKMDTKEMGKLIDTVLDMASEVGIETSYWESVLR